LRKANIILLAVVLLGVAAYAAVWQYRRDMAQKEAATYFTDPRMQKAAEAIFMGDTTALEKALQSISDINAPATGCQEENAGATLLILAVQSNKIELAPLD
jgi:hypothetical protein